MPTKYKMLRIPEDLYNEVKGIKDKKDCLTMTECVRKALHEFIKRD